MYVGPGTGLPELESYLAMALLILRILYKLSYPLSPSRTIIKLNMKTCALFAVALIQKLLSKHLTILHHCCYTAFYPKRTSLTLALQGSLLTLPWSFCLNSFYLRTLALAALLPGMLSLAPTILPSLAYPSSFQFAYLSTLSKNQNVPTLSCSLLSLTYIFKKKMLLPEIAAFAVFWVLFCFDLIANQ